MEIKNRIILFQSELGSKDCKLIAVSKNQAVEKIMDAYHAGLRHFGENKVQEMADKHEMLPKDIQWHMIGHLQRNKVKTIAPWVSLIHSVDSLRLLEEINRQGEKCSRVVPCLLQVYIAREETKFGLEEDEILVALQSGSFQNFKFTQIRGLMGMASFTEDVQRVRNEFQTLKRLFIKLRSADLPANMVMQELSMGMSNDYQIALEEGSTMLRIGTALFGEHKKDLAQ